MRIDVPENCMRRPRWTPTSRLGLMATIAGILALAGRIPGSSCAAQKTQPERKSSDASEPEYRTLQCEDGFNNLHITYYRSPGDKESPVVVLLHMKDGNRFV